LSEENFIVSARKYRPESFDALVGQHAVAETLLHEIQSNKLAQAFLFTGPRGVGKTTSARILAKLINQQDGEDESTDYSFNIFELDAASKNGVEDMRALTEQVRIPPQRGKYKVYIIDEVHMLSSAAFNAFLKTLEEPPAHAIFILATTEKHKVLPTILSRCQVFNFNRIEINDIVKTLKDIAAKENVTYDEKALFLIAQKADGGMRDALSLFDQLVSYAQGNITYTKALDLLNILDYDVFFDTVICCQNGDMASALLLLDKVITNGFDGQIFLGGLAAHLRNLIICKNARTASLLDVSEDFKKKYLEQAEEIEAGFLLNALDLTNACDEKYKISRHPRLLVELLLMKLTQLNHLLASLDDISELKKKALAEGEATPNKKFKTGAIERPVKLKSLENSRFGNIVQEGEVRAPVPESKTPQTDEEAKVESSESKEEVQAESPAPVTKKIQTEPIINPPQKEKVGSMGSPPNDLFAPEQNIQAKVHDENPSNGGLDKGQGELETEVEEQPVLNEPQEEMIPQTSDDVGQDDHAAPENEPVSPEIPNVSEREEPVVNAISETLNEHWSKFVHTFPASQRVAIENATFRLEGTILFATISTGAPLSSFEEIQFSFASFTRANPCDAITQVIFEKGIIEHDDSKPYTEAEKVEYLRQKHPLLKQMMDDWKLH
jgi:DNA polymerase-3 subunit gamma/tau